MGFTKLGFKLMFFLACILSAIVIIFSYTVINIWKHSYIKSAITNTERFSDTIKRSTQYSMMKAQNEAVHEIINAVGQQKGIEWVRIFNKEGKIMYSTNRNEIAMTLDMQAEACYRCHASNKPLERLISSDRSRILKSKEGSHRILATINPIYNQESCYTAACHFHPKNQRVLGILDVAVSLADMDKVLKNRTHNIIIFGIGSVLVICIFVMFFVNRYVGKPVKKILTGTHRISAGDLEHVIDVPGNDEIAHLAQSFNSMSSSLKKAHNDLENWAKKLEKRVAEKTEELKDANMQVVRTEKLASLGRMAAGVAHELNSPLTGILTFAHLLYKKAPEGSPERTDLEVVISETNRCAKIISDLLNFARETKPDKKSVNINDIIEQTISIIEHQSSFHNINIVRHLDKKLPAVIADAAQIKQIFINIILNAGEVMAQGGTLTVTTSTRHDKKPSLSHSYQDYIEITLSDTGAGIPPENMGKIFDPFFTTKDPGQGTGLGLPISIKLAENHGGTIEVKSERGQGTTFTVILPLDGSDLEKA